MATHNRIVELDPEVILAAIEGEPDILQPEMAKHEAFYRQFTCRKCGGAVRKEFDTRHAFADENVMIPRALLRCTTCNHLFDPYTNLELERGDKDLGFGVPLINNKE